MIGLLEEDKIMEKMEEREIEEMENIEIIENNFEDDEIIIEKGERVRRINMVR